jgi:hypothetical protein
MLLARGERHVLSNRAQNVHRLRKRCISPGLNPADVITQHQKVSSIAHESFDPQVTKREMKKNP